MKKFLVLLCSLVLLSFAQNNGVVQAANAKTLSAADLKGKWVIINYWAAWCSACLEEMPELNGFYRHEGANVRLYGFNYERLTGDELNQARRAAKMKFPNLPVDPQTLWSLKDVMMLPTTYIIDPNGRMAKRIIGPSTEQSLKEELKNLQAHA